MSVFYQQPVRRLVPQVLAIIFILLISAVSQAAQVTLAWDPNDPVPDGYRVFVHLAGDTYDYTSPAWPQAGDDPQSTTCTIDNLAEDTQYYFVVRAYVGDDISGDSNEVLYLTETSPPASYTLSAVAGAHGSISPPNASVAAGGDQTFSITPDPNYHVADVLVDGQSVGPVSSYTFEQVGADHTIVAAFAVDAFTISATAGAHGSILPGTVAVDAGGSQTFTITPDAYYHVADVLVDGQSMGAQDSYTFSNIGADHDITATFVRTNQPPVADAGPDQVVDEAQVVTLSGLGSNDPDDGIVLFQWRQVQGDPVVLSSPDQETTTFTSPDVDMAGQALVFELTVTDAAGATATDTCIVNVTWFNAAPTAGAGVDQSVSEGAVVTLDATTSTDPDDDGIRSYAWLQVRGTQVALSDPHSATPHFMAPDVGREGVSLIFELTVTDAGGLQDTDACIVTVTWNNIEPVADAGPDQQVVAGDTVTLDGSGSLDPDGSDLLYQWRQTDGPPVVLSDATAAYPVFTVPVVGFDDTLLSFQLTVTDDGGLQGVDTCQVAVQAASGADTEPPVLTILDPTQDYIEVSTNKIGISGTATDNTAVSRVVWANDRGQSGTATGTESWTIDRLGLHRGTNTYTIIAYDAAGNSQSQIITIQFNANGK